MKNEHGMALISALGTLTILMLLVGMVVALSQTQRFTVATSTQLGDSVYHNESALNRTIWLLMYDKSQYPDRALKPKNDALLDRERFQSDGVPHDFQVNGVLLEVTIRDMNCGLSVAGVNPAAAFTHLSARTDRDSELQRNLNPFKDRLMDYVDSDELLRPNGLERADYEAMGKTPLPRNAPMQFREELLWIPGAEFFAKPDESGRLTDLNIIPPRGMQFASGRPHFFSTSSRLIQEKCDFTDRELEIVENIRSRVTKREVNTDDAFLHYPLLYENLKKQFSFTESPFHTISVKTSPEGGIPGRGLSASLRVNSALGEQNIQFYEYFWD